MTIATGAKFMKNEIFLVLRTWLIFLGQVETAEITKKIQAKKKKEEKQTKKSKC